MHAGQNPNCHVDAWHERDGERQVLPATQSGLSDPFAPADAKNAAPPPDGEIAGASTNGPLPVLNEQSPSRWQKIPLRPGALQNFKWEFSAVHKTRRWNYFITRADWNPSEKLTRAQFGHAVLHDPESRPALLGPEREPGAAAADHSPMPVAGA